MEKEIKRIDYKTESIESIKDKKYIIKITNQTHIGENFGKNEGEIFFKSNNGKLLYSISYPEYNSQSNVLYVRGNQKYYDNREIFIKNKNSFEDCCELLNEYNEYFKKKEQDKMEVNKIDFIAEWDEKFDCGLVKIKNIDSLSKSFNVNSIIEFDLVDRIQIHEKTIEIIINSSVKHYRLTNYAEIIYKKEIFEKIVKSLNYLNYKKVSYKDLHKKLWIGISEGKDKKKYYEELCKEHELPIYNDSCFLCDEFRKNMIKNCSTCRGKFFSNEKLKYSDNFYCLCDGSYYDLWHKETDFDFKKSLATRISKCAD